MTFTTIELSQQGPIALLGLNRPDKLNAIDAVMIDEINAALDQLEADASVQVIVVHGNGRAFCSGFDLQAGAAAERKTEADWRAAIDTDLEMIMRFWHSTRPTIAALHGYVLAGGFEIALACDMSVCDSTTFFRRTRTAFRQQHRCPAAALVCQSETRQKAAAQRAGPHACRRSPGPRHRQRGRRRG
jgi:enoyl-CoA hydratase/carnithine racemase